MKITALVKEKVDAAHIDMLDLLDLSDNICDIHAWLCSDFWSDSDLARIANEIAYGFLGIDGILEESDFEDFRFLLQILPSPIFGVNSLEMIFGAVFFEDDVDDEGEESDDDEDGSVEVEITLNSDSYLEFLHYLYREEFSLLPGDPERVFEYALAYGPTRAFEDLVSDAGVDSYEIMLNLARSEYYLGLGDAYYDMLADLDDGDLTIAVVQVIGDQAERKNAELDDLRGMLSDAYETIDDFCVLTGIDPDDPDDDDDSGDADPAEAPEPTAVSDLPAGDPPDVDVPIDAGDSPADAPVPDDPVTPDPAPTEEPSETPPDPAPDVPDDPPPDGEATTPASTEEPADTPADAPDVPPSCPHHFMP